jgi:RNA polymerase sigma-70 factor (ECF subfamily)
MMGDWPKTSLNLLRRLNDPGELGDPWWEFLKVYGAPICRVFDRCGVSEADANGLLQEVLIRVWSSLASYQGSGPFRGWLYTVARNCYLESVRQRQRERTRCDLLPAEKLEQIPDPHSLDPHWEDDCERRLFQLACDRVREQKDPKHWRVFSLVALEGRSAKEVETSTGVRASYVPVLKGRVQKEINEEVKRLQKQWNN